MSTKIAIQNLSLSFRNEIPALHEVCLNIPAGQIISLIGPSGSGKSTLLRCLNRLWEPPPGAILLDGVDITSLEVLGLRRRVGMLFQTEDFAAGKLEGTKR